MIDASIVRMPQHGACITRHRRQSMGRSCVALTAKTTRSSIRIVCQRALRSRPVRRMTPASLDDSYRACSREQCCSPTGVYVADWINACYREKRVDQHSPHSNRSDPIWFSLHLYRARDQVERFVKKVKHCRWVATRDDGSPPTINRSACGCALMSPHPSTIRVRPKFPCVSLFKGRRCHRQRGLGSRRWRE